MEGRQNALTQTCYCMAIFDLKIILSTPKARCTVFSCLMDLESCQSASSTQHRGQPSVHTRQDSRVLLGVLLCNNIGYL